MYEGKIKKKIEEDHQKIHSGNIKFFKRKTCSRSYAIWK